MWPAHGITWAVARLAMLLAHCPRCRVGIQVRCAGLLHLRANADRPEQAVSVAGGAGGRGSTKAWRLQCRRGAASMPRCAGMPHAASGSAPAFLRKGHYASLALSLSSDTHPTPPRVMPAAGSTTQSCTGGSAAAGPATCPSATASVLSTAWCWASMCRWVAGGRGRECTAGGLVARQQPNGAHAGLHGGSG